MLNQTSRFLTKEYAGTVEVTSRVMDAISIVFGAYIIFRFFDISVDGATYSPLLVLIKILFCFIIFKEGQLYRSWRGRPYSDQFSRLVLSYSLSSLAVTAVWLILGLQFLILPLPFFLWLLLSLLFILTVRAFVYSVVRQLRKKGINKKHIVVFGAGGLGKALIEQIRKSPESGYQVLSLFDNDQSLWGKEINSKKIIGGTRELTMTLNNEDICEVWLALPLKASSNVEEIVNICALKNVSVRLVPDVFDLSLLNHSVTEFLGFPVIDLNVNRMVGVNLLLKRAEDIILGSLFFLLSIPLIISISLLILVSSGGPVIFKQKRLGWDGKVFVIYKFRTMVFVENGDSKTRQAEQDDKRFTKFGKLLRRSSLDELPQIINVLQGRMSLVGPRPHALDHEETFKKQVKGYAQRYKVKPGITGWAQVNDLRGQINSVEDIRRRVQHDLFYIENWSIWFDLRIILTTILKVFFSKQAW